ncbi:UNVERIFIED_CONTAM: Zinc finger CCCH domain-containing protein 17 [Sesamum latifolium]|uniref:Zinc finger CCCH domain-containing protein 17 n=1 Tax=Sesamum latifolium TaxID=2727402 RepID=A0AAW2X661_9LAMI
MTIASSGTHGDIQAQPEVLTAVRTEPENCSSQKAKPKQCKYWITGNCVHGDKCKDLHSWFSGSGFTLLKKLEGHTKVSLIHKYFDTIFLRLLLGFPSHLALTSYIHVARINPFELGTATLVRVFNQRRLVVIGWIANCFEGMEPPTLCRVWFRSTCWLVCSMVLDDDKLFAGMEDGSILVWKLNLETLTLEAAEMLKGHHGAVTSLVVGSNNRLYSGSRDCTIRVWDRQNLQCLHTLYRHTKDIWAATESGTIDVIHEIKEDCGFIALCGIHDAEVKPILLCSCNDTTVRLYDLPSFTERGRIFSKGEVEVIEIGTDGLFFTGDATGEISIWKLQEVPCEETAL